MASAVANYSQSLEELNRSSFPNDGERSKALLAAYALVSRLETPWETVLRLSMGQPALGASLKVAKDLRLFDTWHTDKHDAPQTSEELAKLVSCDVLLLRGSSPFGLSLLEIVLPLRDQGFTKILPVERILRHLGANNLLEEVTPGMFKQTAFTLALLQPVFGEWINYLYDATIPCFQKMPEYLAQTGYVNPTDPADGIFQYTKKFKGNLFDYYKANPQEGKSFNSVMGGVMAHQASWLTIYPHETLLHSSSETSSANVPVILVDVGGNVGHDLERFRLLYPGLAERLVLQDRAEVVCDSICPDPVRKMAHNFFTPQPVKGARAYYMHGVLHDWSDEPALQILSHLKAAMTPGYSKLLIHEHVIPESHPHPQATAYDLTMMVKVSALERSERAWFELLESVGFKVLKLWTSPLLTQSIIEAELALTA